MSSKGKSANSKLKLKDALRESESRFQALANNSNDAFEILEVLFDKDGNAFDYVFLYVNQAFERETGFKQSDFLGKRAKEIMPDLEPYWISVLGKVAKTGVPTHFEEYHKFTNRWYNDYIFKYKEGQVGVLFSNVNDRKKAEEAIRTSEIHYRTLFNSIGEGFELMEMIFDKDGTVCDMRYLEVNDTYEKQTGVKKSVVLGKTVLEVFPKIEQGWIEVFDKVVKTEQPTRLEDYHKDTCKYYSVYYFLFAKNQVGVLFSDVTKRKKAEEEVEKTKNQLETMINSITDGLLVLDKDWRYTYVSETAGQIVGIPAKEILGQCVWEKFPQAINSKFYTEYHRAVETGQPVYFVEYYPEPINRWLELSCYPSKDGLTVFFHDVTERKKAEEAITYQSKLLAQVGEAVLGLDANNNITYWNQGAEEVFGWKAPEALGKNTGDLLQNAIKMRDAEIAKLLTTGQWAGEASYKRKDGNYIDCEVKATTIKDSTGKLTGIVTSIRDITERKRMEEKLKDSRQTFLELVERAPFGIYIVDSQFCVARMNIGSQNGAFRNVRPIIGRDFNEVMRILWPESTALEIISHFRRTLETGEPYYAPRFTSSRHDVEIVASYEWELQRMTLPDGQFGVICYYFDSTKLRDTEKALTDAQAELKNHAENLERLVDERTRQLKDSERLAAIGATAGMVGHDIRNPLQAITSDVYLAKTDLEATPNSAEKQSALESLQGIEDNVVYINKIVQDLQDYARPMTPTAKETDIEAICRDILSKNGVPKNVEISYKAKSNLNFIADPDLVKRILSNLIINAVQAMPNGGKLDIRAHREGNDIVLTVEDTGLGIPQDARSKLFTPMFTTKSKGQGFGLAVVKRITEALGGTVSFESEIDKGTKFILRFPPQRAKR